MQANVKRPNLKKEKNRNRPIAREREFSHLSPYGEIDRGIFEDVFDWLSKPLCFFVQSIVGSVDDADDIVSMAFLKLFSTRKALKSYLHIKRWLYVTVRNAALDHLRLQSRTRDCKNELLYFMEDGTETDDGEFMQTVVMQRLFKAIDHLPKQRTTIVQLYFFEKKSTSEIAYKLHISAQTVLNHKNLALIALRKNVFISD